jgi:hypothetical protein
MSAQLGAGAAGMGEAHQARDSRLDRTFANRDHGWVVVASDDDDEDDLDEDEDDDGDGDEDDEDGRDRPGWSD